MFLKKLFAFLIFFLFFVFPQALFAGYYERSLAKGIGEILIKNFNPESLNVVISQGGSFAWAEASGVRLGGMRVDNMKLRAMLRDIPGEIEKEDKYSLSSMIMMSWGEMKLLEKDVNEYFKRGVNTKGFSHLNFDFTPDGFTVNGIFSAKFLFRIRIRLSAEGKLGIRPDGVYLEDTVIYVEGVRQPKSITNMIINRINPLLSIKKIPFPTKFKRIIMTQDSAIVTSDPQMFTYGERWQWRKEVK